MADLPKKLGLLKEAVEALAQLEPELPKLKRATSLMLEKGHPDQPAALAYYKAASKVFGQALRHTYQAAAQAGNLFYEVLQVYDLDPSLRKSVEFASKYYAKLRVYNPNPKEEATVYEKSLALYRQHEKWAEEALRTGKPKTSEVVGSFRLVNTGGFSESRMKDARGVVERAEVILRARGLGRICYGDILITNDLLEPNVLAFYLIGSDEMYIRGDLRDHLDEVLKTLLHELAHRLHHKFLKHRNSEVQVLYHRVGKEAREGKDPYVTWYAKTNERENFAEMVSYWCLDKLCPRHTELLLPLLSF